MGFEIWAIRVVAFNLDPIHQQRLDELATTQGQDGSSLARQLLIDFLDLHAMPQDSEGDWAEASVAMAPEFMDQEDWGET
jgi:predicted transcriptional regulator